jgi:hypothetical protein
LGKRGFSKTFGVLLLRKICYCGRADIIFLPYAGKGQKIFNSSLTTAPGAKKVEQG